MHNVVLQFKSVATRHWKPGEEGASAKDGSEVNRLSSKNRVSASGISGGSVRYIAEIVADTHSSRRTHVRLRQ